MTTYDDAAQICSFIGYVGLQLAVTLSPADQVRAAEALRDVAIRTRDGVAYGDPIDLFLAHFPEFAEFGDRLREASARAVAEYAIQQMKGSSVH